jgi:hypothetical protein
VDHAGKGIKERDRREWWDNDGQKGRKRTE